MTIAFIDLDGTLLNRKGSEMYFALYLLHRGVLNLKQIACYFRFFFRWFHYFGSSVTKKNKAYLTGLVESDIIAIAEEFASNHLKNYVDTNLFKRLETHRRQGHHLVLLTGSLDFLANPLAKCLNIQEVHATKCSVLNGLFTDSPPTIHPAGIEKRLIADQVAKKHKIFLSNCIAYADSIDDLPLLLSVSKPIAVNPDEELRRMALMKHWEIL